jgi:hypothetical protein
MVPPRQVRARSLFRLSIIARLQFRFRGPEYHPTHRQQPVAAGEFALILNQWVNWLPYLNSSNKINTLGDFQSHFPVAISDLATVLATICKSRQIQNCFIDLS